MKKFFAKDFHQKLQINLVNNKELKIFQIHKEKK